MWDALPWNLAVLLILSESDSSSAHPCHLPDSVLALPLVLCFVSSFLPRQKLINSSGFIITPSSSSSFPSSPWFPFRHQAELFLHSLLPWPANSLLDTQWLPPSRGSVFCPTVTSPERPGLSFKSLPLPCFRFSSWHLLLLDILSCAYMFVFCIPDLDKSSMRGGSWTCLLPYS